MRAHSPRAALTDADIVLLPIRCAATARLRGFEVLSCEPGSDAKYGHAAAHQLSKVLSGEVASLIAGHGLRLWIPLSLEALRRDDSAVVLFDGLAATTLAGTDITFELGAKDILTGTASSNVLAALTGLDSHIAVSVLSDFGSIKAALLADARISEVRLPAAWCGKEPPPGCQWHPEESWVAQTVECLHGRGLLASALDVSDFKLCHEIIVAGFDLIQGDVVGRPHSVEATVDQMVAALPFGRTLL